MQPMLRCQPLSRASAREMLFNQWLSMPPRLDFKFTDSEFEKYQTNKQLKSYDEVNLSSNEAEDSELNEADSEDNEDDEQDIPDSEFYNLPPHPLVDRSFIDRSFTNLGYIGYGDGIQLEELDQTANWQFDEAFKK